MSEQIFHTDIIHNGTIKIQQVATLPGAVSSSDARRIIYTADTKLFYMCDGTSWTQISTFDHNDLPNIQGGNTDEYYHLTEDEYDAIENSYSPDATNPFATRDSVNQYMHIRDEKSTNTSAQALTAGDNVRELTVVKANTITGASLSSNEFTLPAGTYKIWAKAKERTDSAAGTAGGKTVLSIYDGSDHLLWDTKYMYGYFSEPQMDDYINLFGIITLASETTLSLHQNVQYNVWGGLPVNVAGFNEVYAEVIIFKDAT